MKNQASIILPILLASCQIVGSMYNCDEDIASFRDSLYIEDPEYGDQQCKLLPI